MRGDATSVDDLEKIQRADVAAFLLARLGSTRWSRRTAIVTS